MLSYWLGWKAFCDWWLTIEEMEAQVHEDEDFVHHELGELPMEEYKHPYFWASLAPLSPVVEEGLLCPIMRLTSGSEPDNLDHLSLESITTTNPENVVAIPVVHQTSHSHCRHSPCRSPPASSTSWIAQSSNEHHTVQQVATYPGWGLVTEFTPALSPLHR